MEINKEVFNNKRLDKSAYIDFISGRFNVKTLIAMLVGEGYNVARIATAKDVINPFILKSSKYVQFYSISCKDLSPEGECKKIYQLYNPIADKFIKLERYQYLFAVEFLKLKDLIKGLPSPDATKLYFSYM